MGASDAINALRSEAVAVTSLINVVSEHVAGINTDGQKQSSMIREARGGASNGLNKENDYVDGKRMELRRSLKSAGPASLKFIFNAIKVAMGSGSPVGLGLEAAAIAADMAIMNEDIQMRDRHWQNALVNGTYVSMYTPRVEPAR